MVVEIPVWSYVFGTMTYVLAALVGIPLSYFSFRLYSLTGKREQRFLFYAMVFITLGFFILSVVNIYGFSNFQSCFPICQFDLTDPNYSFVIKGGNYVYYLTSLIGYILFALTYLKSIKIEKILAYLSPKKFLFILPFSTASLGPILNQNFLYPFENLIFQLFHLLAIVILSYINFNTVTNYLVLKSKNSFPVMVGFLSIGLYHFLMALTSFKPIIFVVAHLSLLIGLLSLLWMLVKVNSK